MPKESFQMGPWMRLPDEILIKGSLCDSNGMCLMAWASVAVMGSGCYANAFRLDSHLADFSFFLYFFSGFTCYLYGLVLG